VSTSPFPPAAPHPRERSILRRLLAPLALIAALGLGGRVVLARLCPLEPPDVPGVVWIAPVEALEPHLFADVIPLALGDIDGDGFSDLAVGIPMPYAGLGRVHVLSGRDGSRLLTWTEDPPASGAFGRRLVAVGDVDRGGLPDLAVSAGQAVYLLSGESGERALAFPDVEGHILELRDVGDLDGDGCVDLGLAFARPVPRVEIRSSATGTRLREVTALAPGRFPLVHALDRDWLVSGLGDIDGDGVPDFAAGSAAGGHCDGPLTPDHVGLVAALSGSTGAELWVVPSARDAEGWPSDLASIRDRDGDGIPDLAIGSPGRVEFLSGRTGAPIASLDGPPATDWGKSVRAAGDLDGDGIDDLIVVCTNPNTRSGQPFPSGGYFELLSGADLAMLHRIEMPCRAGADHLAPVGDYDGDGRDELVLPIPVMDRSKVDWDLCYTLGSPTSWVLRVRAQEN
jgi:hypothetical protein